MNSHPTTILGILLWISAATPVLSVDGPLLATGPGRLINVGGTRGFSFDIAHELTVTGLAKFDANDNGLLDDLTETLKGCCQSS